MADGAPKTGAVGAAEEARHAAVWSMPCCGGAEYDTESEVSYEAACCTAVDGASTCPMTALFRGTGDAVRPRVALLLLIPALVLLALGSLIVVEPIVLAWLAAVVLGALGLALVVAALKLRGFLATLRRNGA